VENNTSEIEKLTERIAKDPKSKLFVPLAEEYKKTGDIEMAIQVLTDGLKSNPGYVTARSFLGRLLLDKGDLGGAQKELEEVIKAIPDNLLAQRKLGDLYVLQGRGSDALQRYKAALALNPADKELPSLLVDLEAGRDVSARIPRPKSAVANAAAQAPPVPASQAKPKAAPFVAAKSATPLPVHQETPQKTVSAAAPKTEAMPAAPVEPKTAAATTLPVAAEIETASVVKPSTAPSAAEPSAPQTHDEVEVIEDILEIEHLEKPESAPDILEAPFEMPAESVREPAPSAADAFAAPSFDLSEIPTTASTDAGDKTDASWGVEPFSALPASSPGGPSAVPDEGGDDLNTNTLAELYISQGFYDKAIEIYQGMLGDRPDNKALQKKLEDLRAMAGTAEKGAQGFATAVVPKAAEYSPPAGSVSVELQPTVERPAAVPAEVPGPSTATAQPLEPTPVEAALEKVVREGAPESAVTPGPQTASIRRKETIHRLESWLTNIMKEKK